MNTPRMASGYTTRANYQAEYRESHREAINARKRAWREARKNQKFLVETLKAMEQEAKETGR